MNIRQQSPDGSWSEAVPLPYFLAFGFKKCRCGRKFRRMATYQFHYQIEHQGRTR